MRNIKIYTQHLNEEKYHQELNHDMINAARMGKIRKVKQLLDEGADVNSVSDLDWTALHEAAWWGYRNIAKLLIDRGADVNARNSKSQTPLHLTAIRILPLKHNEKKPEIAKILIDAGAEVDAIDLDDKTPLMYCVPKNPIEFKHGRTYYEIAKAIILGGADPMKAFDGPEAIIEFFDGDIDWMPEALRLKLQRMQRGRSAFGM